MTQPIYDEDYAVIRDYLQERSVRVTERWRIISQYDLMDDEGNIDEVELARIYELESITPPIIKYQTYSAFHNDLKQQIDRLIDKNKIKGENFEFYRKLNLSIDNNTLRINPEYGIKLLPLKYHEIQPITISDDAPIEGFKPAAMVKFIIHQQYPQYITYLHKYCRPLGTTDATFTDFNKEQKPSQPLDQDHIDHVIHLVKHFLHAQPYLPVRHRDTVFARLPLSTGTGYYDRTCYKTHALARLTRGEMYKQSPTSKGFYYNATVCQHTHIAHNLKSYGCPISTDDNSPELCDLVTRRLIAQRATMLFTRVHISTHDKRKIRPVYNVDPLFLKIEAMLTLPLMAQMRPTTSCIMYSLETIRGGCHYLDDIAQQYNSYFTIDWSSFDQMLPRIITDTYYTDFLESLVIINKRYARNVDYQKPDPDNYHKYFVKMSNLLHFLHEWYNSMVFVTADGYSYQRTSAGVPSGLFNTQLLDSYGNLFLIIDGFINYGFTDIEITNMRLFIMGDDNTGFTPLELIKLEHFIQWFESYALHRWNMKLSKSKSIITELRQKIEILGYRCNFGSPTRDVGKLVAQLAYPEHGVKLKYMSYRALGIAYAAAGQDETFHQLCRDVYMAYLQYQPELTRELKSKLRKHLPGIFKLLDEYFTIIDHTRFPSIYEVRDVYKKWLGPLPYTPRWDTSFFSDLPYYDKDDAITIKQYRTLYNIPRKPVKDYIIDHTII